MPLFSVSGLRGVVGEDLTPEVILRHTHAYLSWLEEQGVREVLVGRDTRLHGPALQALVESAALFRGFRVLRAGVVPTPVLVWGVRHLNTGGVVITASHNPPEWNALKFLHPEGRFPRATEINAIAERLEDAPEYVSWDRVGTVEEINLAQRYREAFHAFLNGFLPEKLPNTLSVLVDAGGGATYALLPRLLEERGARVIPLHTTPQGRFPRPAEPMPSALVLLDAALKNEYAPYGVASDPDGDRMVLGLAREGVLSEEATLPVILRFLARRGRIRGPVVANFSTSRWVDEAAWEAGVEVIRAPVGEANVLARMHTVGADFGGEGNGGVIWPEWNACRDGLLAAVLGAYALAMEGETLFRFTPRFRVKKKVPGRRLPEGLAENLDAEEVQREDGVYLRWGETWIHVRPSNTEPVIRLVGESPSREALEERIREIENILETRRVS